MLFRNKQRNKFSLDLVKIARSFWHNINKIILILLVVLSVAIFGVINTTYAKPASDMTPTEGAKSWVYYNAISACIDDNFVYLIDDSNWWLGFRNDRIGVSNASSGKWFDDPLVGATNPSIGYFLTGKSGISVNGDSVGCGGANVNWILDAVKLWGYSNGIDALCDFGAKRVNGSDCRDGSGDFTGESAIGKKLSIEKFKASIKSKVYNGSDPSLSDAAKYALYRDSFNVGCLGNTSPAAYTGSANDQYTYTIKSVSSDGKTVTDIKYYGIRKHTDNIDFYVDSNGNNQGDECINIANEINRLSSSYQKSVVSAGPDSSEADDTNTVTSTTSCSIDSIGWMVCPVVNFMSKVVDGAYGMVEKMLITPSVNMDISNPQNGTYQAWSIMRSIANVAFVLVFLIIIFSQITSIGISNYGIKKLLPRLVIAAILVNVSYYICAVVVDLSNIIGGSLKEAIDNIAKQIPLPEGFTYAGNTWSSLAISVLAGGAILYVGLSALLPALIAALAAILTVFLVLTLRQVLIVLLIVISPLAFVAFLLPNTSKWFDKWKDLFSTLLIMYPIIALIFGASALASRIIMSTDSYDGLGDTVIKIMGALMAIIPLAITPIVMKTAGGLLNRLGMIIDNPNKGIFDRMNKGAQNLRQREVNRMNNSALNKVGGFSPRRAWLRYNSRTTAIDENQQREMNRAKTSYIAGLTDESSSFANKMTRGGTEGSTDRARAAAQSVLAKLESDEINAASVLIQGELTKLKATGKAGEMDNYLSGIARTGSANQSMAALNELAKMGRDGVLRPMVGSSDFDQTRLQSAISSNFGSLKDKAPDLVKGKGPAFDAVTGNALASFSKQTSAAYMNYLDELNSTINSINENSTEEQIAIAEKAKATLSSAVASFNTSIEDIKLNPSLQASFVGESGKSILSSASKELRTQLTGLNSIDPTTGKIR